MKKLIYRGHELDERIWLRIKNDPIFKKMFDDCLDDLYHPQHSKREDYKISYILFEQSQVSPCMVLMGEIYNKEDAEKWVGNNPLRHWYVSFRDAVL